MVTPELTMPILASDPKPQPTMPIDFMPFIDPKENKVPSGGRRSSAGG